MAAGLQAAHQLRLQQLLDAGRLTPAPSASPSPAASPTPDGGAAAAASTRRGKKRSHPKPNLAAVAEHLAAGESESGANVLPDRVDFVVAVSTRSPDVGLENDHNLHCLCSFPTHQAAYDYILKHRLALARHYLQDSKLSEEELLANANAAGMDELYLGEHTSMEILQVAHFDSAERAPPPNSALFADHFASKREEERAEEELKESKEEAAGEKDEDAAAAESNVASGKKNVAAGKGGTKRRKV